MAAYEGHYASINSIVETNQAKMCILYPKAKMAHLSDSPVFQISLLNMYGHIYIYKPTPIYQSADCQCPSHHVKVAPEM